MKNLYFITSGAINYQLTSLSLYESIRITANNKKFPSLTEVGVGEVKKVTSTLGKLNLKTIVSAPSQQCLQTAEIIGELLKIPIKINNALLPLRFDLTKLIPKGEFDHLQENAFNVLRQRYLKAFFDNQLTDNNQIIIGRLQKLLKYSDSLFISHAYLIKFFQIYALIGNSMFTDYPKLSELFRPQIPTLRRLEVVKIAVAQLNVKL